MQPQDPAIDSYNRLLEGLEGFNVFDKYQEGLQKYLGLAQMKSQLASENLRQREAQLQLDFLPQEQNMRREEFGMNKQSFANQQELFKQGKTLWPYQTQNAQLEARMKKFEADHQKSNWDFGREMAKLELSLKKQELGIRAGQLKIQSAKNDIDRSKATQDYIKQYTNYTAPAAVYAALAAKYRGMAAQLSKGDKYGDVAPFARVQIGQLQQKANEYARMASTINTQAVRLFPELAPTAEMYKSSPLYSRDQLARDNAFGASLENATPEEVNRFLYGDPEEDMQ
jgi:hypothetical protein